MQDARCAEALIVLLSTALVTPAETQPKATWMASTRNGWVHVQPQPASWPGIPLARLRAWQRQGKTR
jgi:hypothetical protein